ncbi:hypothetical protein [Paenibacillus arenilitoris]|uniref:Uncharacterized protein n=1 Tax=Paenibacillus arenilitoris TaxID=2772299 RepID=A0A927CP50_9BACL|nr:hypothetical protein [Paenibacillus arenilitoris]MBD2870487.1 hypothetical protein [Paenibacillus arenilitoris]
MEVAEARVRRSAVRDGIRCGEVEVATDETGEGRLFAYFSLSEDNDFDMQAVVRSDARPETDWLDSNRHQVCEDVTVDLFLNVNMKTNWGARETFKEQVLSFGQVRGELADLLGRPEH